MNSVRHRRSRRQRRGAAILELAIVLLGLLTVLFALFDMGLAVLRSNALSDAARRAARLASLRGDKAPSPLVPLGPDEIDADGAEDTPLTTSIRPFLFTMPPADVSLHATWPDGGHQAGDRVSIELTYHHKVMFSRLFNGNDWTLSASSTVPIQ